MLSDRQMQLLTAFVDGELTRRQRKAVSRLLNRSTEARSVLQDFQENAHKLMQLPLHPLPPEFCQEILRALPAPTPALVAAAVKAAPRQRWLPWVGVAAAAAVVLAVGLRFYLADSSENLAVPGPVLAKGATLDPWLGHLIDGAVHHFAIPLPAGLQIAFRDLEQIPLRDRLTQELQKETAFHLDLNVRQPSLAVERIHNVLKTQGITLLIDGPTQANLKKNDPRGAFVVYAENLRPEEVTAFLHQLNEPSKNTGAFESLRLTGFTREDQNQLSGLFRVGPELFLPPLRDDPMFQNTFIEKTKDKGSEKINETTPKTVPPQRYAVVLASAAQPAGVLSPEMKTFLATRSQQRPGTVQLLVVVHAA